MEPSSDNHARRRERADSLRRAILNRRGFQYRTSDFEQVHWAEVRCDDDLLTILENNIDSPLSLGRVRDRYNDLRRHGHPDPVSAITMQKLAVYGEIETFLLACRPYPEGASKTFYLLLAASQHDAERMLEVARERSIFDLRVVEDMLATNRSAVSGLDHGSL